MKIYKDILERCELLEKNVESFKNHEITIKKYADIKVIDFKKQDTSHYYIRYIFDNGKIIVSGDLGTAIYVWNWGISLNNFEDIQLDYFNGKCSCSSEGKTSWCGDTAIKALDEHYKDYISDDEENGNKEEIKEYFSELKNTAYDKDEYYALARDYDLEEDAYEWIFDVGNVVPLRHKLHLYGLVAIQRELNKQNKG